MPMRITWYWYGTRQTITREGKPFGILGNSPEYLISTNLLISMICNRGHEQTFVTVIRREVLDITIMVASAGIADAVSDWRVDPTR